ncbi:MAG: EscU/YscU/HrcU family type III secretion system export apparatus switch protein [Lachnospiraceae bacterium]|nr:EscU/YscU/HrcU family type III secretion system export apparatus switch protein [Lachnospiraceae bacterium]
MKQEGQTGSEKERVRQAIALEYDGEDAAPRVIATGKGALAERIIERAKEADVPVHRDDKLADTLSRLQIGDMIPPELYEVVAEILVFVDAMDKIQSKLKR